MPAKQSNRIWRTRVTRLSVAALTLVASTVTAADAVPDDDSASQAWRFKVLLNDREIGFHDFRVSNDGAHRRVETEARFDVRFLLFNAYRYRHRSVETWRDNCLATIDATTDDNGTRLRVTGAADQQQFQIETSSDRSSAPSCVMSFAYWNPEMLNEQRLLNSQTGQVERVVVTPRGPATVRFEGRELPARRYDLSVEGTLISLWYDATDFRWLALETPAKGKRVLRYEPVALPPTHFATASLPLEAVNHES